MPTIRELREERAGIVEQMKVVVDTAEAEKRALTDEEQAKHDELYDAQEKLAKHIQTLEKQRELDREMAESASGGNGSNGTETPETRSDRPAACPEYRTAFEGFLRGDRSPAEILAEHRALQADVDVSGGYLVAPEQMVTELIKAVDDAVILRQFATTFTVTDAASLGVVSLDADPADADWTVEIATGGEDSAMALGKRNMTPNPLGKLIKLSNTLIRKTSGRAEQLVLERLGYKFGITHEKAGMTGNGAGQMLGVFTASADGISTARDVSTDNTTTAITFDGLIEAKFTLKGQYHPRARWIFHRDAVKMITKLKDGDGQYIWQQDVKGGGPDTILGIPFSMSEFAPNTFTTGLYVGLLGDLSFYWIVDSLSMQIQRLVELYAVTNQVGFIGRLESDGQPVLEEAFVRVTLA